MIKRLIKLLLIMTIFIFPLNSCWAEEAHDEEITLPVGSCFDLNIPEIAGYEVDQSMVMLRTIYGKETPVLKRVGDTVITILIKLEDSSRMRLNVLVHVVPPDQFMKEDNGNPENKK